MANKARHMYGDDQPLLIPIASAVLVEIGDFVAVVANLAVPVADVADGGDAAANREACSDIFFGIAESASAAGETEPVRVGTAGVWNLTQKSAAAIHVGDPVEIYASADHCESQTVVEGATSPIGVCVEESAAGGDIKVKILPKPLNQYDT